MTEIGRCQQILDATSKDGSRGNEMKDGSFAVFSLKLALVKKLIDAGSWFCKESNLTFDIIIKSMIYVPKIF